MLRGDWDDVTDLEWWHTCTYNIIIISIHSILLLRATVELTSMWLPAAVALCSASIYDYCIAGQFGGE